MMIRKSKVGGIFYEVHSHEHAELPDNRADYCLGYEKLAEFKSVFD